MQKETVQPSVVHTTVPVHEVHQNEDKHHTATQHPAVTMDDLRKQGDHLSGREERTDAFGGEPKAVGGTLGGVGARGATSLTDPNNATHGSNGGHTLDTTSSPNSVDGTDKKPSVMDKLNPKKDADGDGKADVMK